MYYKLNRTDTFWKFMSTVLVIFLFVSVNLDSWLWFYLKGIISESAVVCKIYLFPSFYNCLIRLPPKIIFY